MLDVQGPFSSIVTCSPIDVVVVPGTDYSVSLTADDSATTATSVKNSNGALTFSTTGSFSTSSPYYATVTMPKDALTGLKTTGSGDIVVNSGFEASDFAIDSAGSGDITLGASVSGLLKVSSVGSGDIKVQGSVAEADISSSGSGGISLYNLATSAKVNSLGSGDVYINAASGAKLTGSLMGSGDVEYSGDASCDISSLGSGDACDKSDAKKPLQVAVTSFPGGLIQSSGTGSC